MSIFRRGPVHVLAVAFLLGSALLLSCQPAQPAATPKEAEKAVATPAKAGETPAAAATKPAAQAAEKPVRGGTLRIAEASDFSSLDPNTMTPQAGFYSLYEQLIEPDKDGNLTKEGLFKDWNISGDGKSITFKLQGGVKFHDGTDLDAAAVKFNLERVKDPATKSPHRSDYAAVDSVEVVDNLTVRFNLSRPDVLILTRLAGTAGGLMVSPAGVQKYGVDFTRHPVGSGPFQFVEWVPSDHVTMKRFEGYWKKDKDGNRLPYLDGVVWQFIPDVTTAVANFRTGQIDLVGAGPAGIPLEQQPLVKNDPSLAYQIHSATATATAMNTKRAPFDNQALRQAVALALDREGMAGRFGATAWASIFHPTEGAYDDGKSGVSPARDVSKAKAKMAEAGYAAGGLKVKYTSNSSPDGVIVAQIVKANLAEIGIEVEIETLASSAWNAKVRNEWNYQISSCSTGIVVGDPGHYLSVYWHSRGSRNFFGPYSNPRFDEPLDKALATYDQKARAALYNEAVKVMVEDAPCVPLYVANSFAGMSKKVRNFFFHGNLVTRSGAVWLEK